MFDNRERAFILRVMDELGMFCDNNITKQTKSIKIRKIVKDFVDPASLINGIKTKILQWKKYQS